MPYSLSFSDEFFVDDDPDRMIPSRRPTSVVQAILSLREDRWRHIAEDVFSIPPDQLSQETVLEKIVETNTCSNLDDPVEVWIDPEGDHTLRVYSPM